MTDLDQLLEKAGTDARKSLRTISTPAAATIHRQVRRHRIMVVLAALVLVAGLGTSAVLLSTGSAGDVASDPDALITTEMILEDGIVTEEEYRAGADAVVACLTDVGVEASVDYDRGGYAVFQGDIGRATLEESLEETGPYNTTFDRCFEAHLGYKVFFLRAVQRGEIDPEKSVAYNTALFECVEVRTGRDLGEVSFDSDGFPTPAGEQALQEALFAEEDHRSWEECQDGLDIDFLSGWLAPDLEHDLEAGDGLEVVERSGLTLTLRGALDNPCIEVKSEKGMAGGCGADFTQPLNITVGATGGISFVDGWAAAGTAKVVVTLADGTEIEVTDLVAVEGFDVLFFLELMPPTVNGESELPIMAVALDRSGEVVADFVLSEPEAP